MTSTIDNVVNTVKIMGLQARRGFHEVMATFAGAGGPGNLSIPAQDGVLYSDRKKAHERLARLCFKITNCYMAIDRDRVARDYHEKAKKHNKISNFYKRKCGEVNEIG